MRPWTKRSFVQGLITIDISEADDAERERHRRNMAEPYRAPGRIIGETWS